MSEDHYCPICLAPAEHARDRDYGERRQVRCQRCGTYEISRTALAMLESRVDRDPLARARLSHAIRQSTSETKALFVGSTNLDELAQSSLPGVQRQLENLARWVASQLLEDRFGRVEVRSRDMLAGVIGAVDGERVERLIAYAAKEGVIDCENEAGKFGLSPKGWAMIEPSKHVAKQTKPDSRASGAESEIVKALCNQCDGERNAYRRASHTVEGNDEEVSWSDTYDVLECCGCSGISVRHEFWFSEWDQFDQDPITGQPSMIPGVKVNYWPPPTNRKKPDWADKIEDDVLRSAIDEVYQALNYGLIVLASIGTRTLLDRAMFLRVGDPNGGFIAKLGLMVERGHIGIDEKDILETITDAGSAAAHRGFAPEADTLATIVETVENFLHREFVLKTEALKVRAATPPRNSTEKE